MKQITSSEFQKTYARLDEAVQVTVHGRVIGTWVPGDPAQKATAVRDFGTVRATIEERYDQRPVTAAPKAEKKRR